MSGPINTNHCSITGIIVLEQAQAMPKPSQIALSAYSALKEYTCLDKLIAPGTVDLMIDYYNNPAIEFLPFAVAICTGTLSVKQDLPNAPKITIKANVCSPCKGDPSTDEYANYVPRLTPPTLFFSGQVVGWVTSGDGKRPVFFVKITTYNSKVDNQVITDTFHIGCEIPQTKRWANIRYPNIGRIVEVNGELIGFYPYQNEAALCVSVTSLSFLRIPQDCAVIEQSTTPAPNGPKRKYEVLGASSVKVKRPFVFPGQPAGSQNLISQGSQQSITPDIPSLQKATNDDQLASVATDTGPESGNPPKKPQPKNSANAPNTDEDPQDGESEEDTPDESEDDSEEESESETSQSDREPDSKADEDAGDSTTTTTTTTKRRAANGKAAARG
ncbi:hypothetical protein DTO169C6_4685 [Paecilomyces variotii]|nr:hypothetical protein DTO169C6_4685 [Paecilomyces variotii]KAJ9361057.1 hypothetical protein DTO027B9_906 [Paecilomyces variotii]